MVMYLILLIKKNRKSNFCVYFKKMLIYFQKSRSSVFTFDLKRELDSSFLLVLATKLFHIAERRVDTRNLLLRSLVFGLL